MIRNYIKIAFRNLKKLGLVSFESRQRLNDTGIRKVSGASVASITTLLIRDFLKLVIAAFVIAFPVSWLLMDRWLMDFAYRISMQWWHFAFAGGTALFIALITMRFQAPKAAMANPAITLRSQ